ncbi:hypothetical protein Pisl_0487 [Pyrobaculum islandicum DSM 4184]|uniref:Uncharacterized protein n=1 Tax=Pyrobaculum islandicum (strain DSM 4184 / JCM 9189 / GEO3) TaxID=384616 RepID=A1RRT3_PYRIL|nr:hypothetical protein Pisl_0487 [Pyrobaculum islandicum DSM 4184]
MEVVVVFRGQPPDEWKGVPGVRALSMGELGDIERRLVLVVGDREFAERLGVGYLTEEETEELLAYIKARLSETSSRVSEGRCAHFSPTVRLITYIPLCRGKKVMTSWGAWRCEEAVIPLNKFNIEIN